MKIKRKLFMIAFMLIIFALNLKASRHFTSYPEYYTTAVVFPATYKVGDYIEFVSVAPLSAGASGNYEISISYTRNNIAAAATHLAAVSHANPDTWRETGRINNNKYVDFYSNFTIDCNTQYGNARFRIRAVDTYGDSGSDLRVEIRITSRNFNSSFSPLSKSGNDTSINKFVPMTNDWELYVGKLYSTEGASLAIKATQEGNVGIGTATPDEKLTVNGKIHAKEIKVDLNVPAPDYVFEADYELPKLKDIQSYIAKYKHLPEVPSAKEMEKNGINLSNMNMLLLKKVEELTLHLIEKDQSITHLESALKRYETVLFDLRKELLEFKKQINK